MKALTSMQLSKWCAASALALGVVLLSAPAPAVDIPVLLGDVGVGKQSPEVRRQLRAMLNTELSKTDFAQVKTHEHFVLSATLVRLDSIVATDASDSVRATCVVSLAVLRDNGATLHAVIRGRATAEESKAHADTAQSDALRGAVHSAITRVPQAIR